MERGSRQHLLNLIYELAGREYFDIAEFSQREKISTISADNDLALALNGAF